MAQSVNVIHVQPGARANEILAGLAERLHFEFIRPDDAGRAEIWLQMAGPEARDLIVASLDETAVDWRDYISIAQPGD
jgi:hypothetical protein